MFSSKCSGEYSCCIAFLGDRNRCSFSLCSRKRTLLSFTVLRIILFFFFLNTNLSFSLLLFLLIFFFILSSIRSRCFISVSNINLLNYFKCACFCAKLKGKNVCGEFAHFILNCLSVQVLSFRRIYFIVCEMNVESELLQQQKEYERERERDKGKETRRKQTHHIDNEKAVTETSLK